MNEIADQEWVKRLRGLDPAERSRRLEAVQILLAEPDQLSTPLEAELYILRDELRGPAPTPTAD